jgi:DNA-binding CsgD family transcriptional regulator
MATSLTIPLSEREATVLLMITWGYTNKEIGSRLGISAKTVEAHKANGMRKLHVRGRSSLVRLAVEWGWLTPEKAPDHDSEIWLQAASVSAMAVRETSATE